MLFSALDHLQPTFFRFLNADAPRAGRRDSLPVGSWFDIMLWPHASALSCFVTPWPFSFCLCPVGFPTINLTCLILVVRPSVAEAPTFFEHAFLQLNVLFWSVLHLGSKIAVLSGSDGNFRVQVLLLKLRMACYFSDFGAEFSLTSTALLTFFECSTFHVRVFWANMFSLQ